MPTIATAPDIVRDARTGNFTRRYRFQPVSFNAEDSSVEVVLSSFAVVARAGHLEHLPSDPADWTIPESVPLLDTHSRRSIRDIIGQVRDISFRDGLMVGTAYISDPATAEAVQRGDVRGVSIGVRYKSHSDRRDKSGKVNRFLAGATLVEVSLTSDPADPGATVRSHPIMEEDDIETPEVEVTSGDVQTRSSVNTHIRSFEDRGISRSFIDCLIDTAPTLEEANAAIRAELGRRPVITIGRSSEDPTVVRSNQAEALAAGFTGAEPSEGARQYMGLQLLDHARICVSRSGDRNVATMGADSLVTRAMGRTSDFPIVLDDAGLRVVLASYQAAESPLKRIAIQRNIPDFRDLTAIRTGGLPTLKKVTEAGEIKHSTILENGEKFRLETYAEIFGLSRKVIINDRFNVLGDCARNAGIAAANTERELLLALLLEGSGAGPMMSDGKRVFHVDHGNLAADGAAPDVDELSAARLAMRMQTGLDGESRISVVPKFFLVAADLETKAEQLLASLSATTVGDQNPFAGKLELLVDPDLPEGSWYLAADPASVPTLAYGYLSSAPGPQLASREGWDVLGREWRVVLDFGAGFLDWRGIYRNPGEDI